MSDRSYIASVLAIGIFFAVHCTRATIRESRAGKTQGGDLGDYERGSSPLGFWMIMSGNAAATLMGAAFLLFGILYLLVDLGGLK